MEQKTNKYEGFFLLNTSRITPEGGGATKTVGDLLKKHGAAIVRVDVWDERKLAYAVKDQKRGTYVLAHFEAASPAVAAIRNEVNISEDVLRAIVLRHEPGFPTFRTAAEYAALQPKRDSAPDGRRRDGDDEEGGRGRWREGDDFEMGSRGEDEDRQG